ncbi:MAG: hypothetical protein R3C25_06900 [Hyphomonadaceae bacterium]
MSDNNVLLAAIYQTRREQVLFHLKGQDDALKSYLVVAAALAAASQAQGVGGAALLAVPLVAIGMALSFSFHHLYIGVIVSFLRYDFKSEIGASKFPEWDRSKAHGRAVWPLRILTVASAAFVVTSSALACFAYGLDKADATLIAEQPWLRCYGLTFSWGAGAIIVGTGLYRWWLELSARHDHGDGGSDGENEKQEDKSTEARG